MTYTEFELVEGCRANSRKHQQALYQRYAGKMFAISLRYAEDRMQAEDFLQEGFLKVFTHMEQFKGQGSLEGWIRRVIVTTALQHLRRHKNDPATLNPELSLNAVGEEGGILGDLAVEEIMKLINKLPTGYRLVFNLYVLEQYSHKEIAEELGISEGTSKSQLARARGCLQQMLKKNEDFQHTQQIGVAAR
ncbi:MAG: sigma-70 family RNA polymerase sigma factor [Bacteroidota bacterium]|nr:sigma-70 family RNA polymerase sigma factor [Bacteroidota bacterium]